MIHIFKDFSNEQFNLFYQYSFCPSLPTYARRICLLCRGNYESLLFWSHIILQIRIREHFIHRAGSVTIKINSNIVET